MGIGEPRLIIEEEIKKGFHKIFSDLVSYFRGIKEKLSFTVNRTSIKDFKEFKKRYAYTEITNFFPPLFKTYSHLVVLHVFL